MNLKDRCAIVLAGLLGRATREDVPEDPVASAIIYVEELDKALELKDKEKAE